MNAPYDTRLPPDLRALKLEIEAHARQYGLEMTHVKADGRQRIRAFVEGG